MEKVRVTICPEKTQGIIHPNIFSHNLEHTRSCIYQGLSAQILRNRKFAGKPAAHSGQAAEWYRIGGREVYFTLDRFDAYVRHSEEWFTGILQRRNECNSQVVQNPYVGMEAGVGQDGIVLEKDKSYQVRSVVKTNSDEAFSYTIRIVNARTRRMYAEHIETPAQHEWEKTAFVFTAPESTDNACFEVITHNRGEMKIGVVSLIPTDHVLGLRPDVIDKLREIGPSVLRWPGGNFAGEYHWKDGLMDVDMRGAQKSVREMETHPYTQGFDFHEMAIDDFIQLCHLIGAEPYLTINFGRDTAETCAQFVEYCNGTADTEWGKVRAERGFEQPYAVKYWSLGNEQGLGHMDGPNTPAAYTAKATQYARKMREVDPEIVLFASGAYNPDYDYREWLAELPKLAAEGVHYISYHNYAPRIFEGGADFVTDNGLKNTYATIIGAPDKCLTAVEKLRELMNENGCSAVSISYDEWNLYFAWYHDPGVLEGLYTALMLDMLCKNHQRLNISMVMYFQPINEGAIVVEKTYAELTACGQMMGVMKEHKGNLLLQSMTDDEDVRCLVSLDKQEDMYIATLINKSLNQDKTLELQGITGLVEARLFRGESLMMGTRFAEYDVSAQDGSMLLPAHSVMRLRIKNV